MSPVPEQPSRRGFLNWFLGTSVGAMLLSVAYPVSRYISPPDVPEAQTSRVVAAQEGELKPNSGKIFRFGSLPGLLIRTTDGEYKAFAATCTHLNCTVQYKDDTRQIWCACHNGVYDLQGHNVSGPPPRPLEEYKVNVADGEIVVSRIMSNGGAGRLGRILDWLEERAGWSFLVDLGKKKQVPQHRHTLWYYLGGMTLFLFILQVATGILLLLYYRASAEEAFESVQFIMAKVPFGWLIRSIHSWSANLLVFVLFVHMFSVFFLKAYRRPRELTWLSGMGLLFLMLGFGFSGYLLPWNKLAFFATQVGTDIAGALPLVGHFALRFLRGGEQVTGGTLTRFYGFHVAVLPALTMALLGLHLLLVQKHGMSVPPSIAAHGKPGAEAPKSMSFWPHFILRDAIGWCAALGVLAALAALFPWELGEKADPFAPAPAGIRPEWYFAWMFQTLKYLPAHILGIEGELLGILGIGVAALVWLLVPFLDRSPAPGNRVSRLFTLAGWLALAYMAVMTLIVYLPQGH